jgi:hypothetical protein
MDYSTTLTTLLGIDSAMKKIVYIFATFLIVGGVCAPSGASAAYETWYPGNYYNTTSQGYRYAVDNSAQIRSLVARLAALQAELARLQGTRNMGDCYWSGGYQYCTRTMQRERDTWSDKWYRFDGNDNDADDIDSIDVTIDRDDNDARVRVDVDRFHYNTDNKNRIIERLADDLDIDEDDVEDIVDFDYEDSDDDVESIDVTIDRDENDARARVEYENGDVDRFHYNTDNKNRIIERLADDLDMDEDDVEDIIDFDYE